MTEYSSAALPGSVDTVVIGGGIAGISAAYQLARDGVSVLVCEKGRIAGEQSSRNWGFVRQQGRDPAEIPLIIESLRLWRGLNKEIGAETGFRQTGVLYLADRQDGLRGFEEWLPYAQEHQLGTRMLSSKEISDLIPEAQRTWAGGMVTPTDGRAEPSLATQAIAKAVTDLGGFVQERCAVRGIETSAGRISAVITEHGRVDCNAVLLAGGAWSRIFLRSLGIELPQLTVRASVQRTSPAPAVVEGALWSPDFAIRRRLDGGFTLAHGSRSMTDLTPDHFRFLPRFLKLLREDSTRFKIRIGRRFIDMLRMPKRWDLDRPSPFEAARVLDPEPVASILDSAFQNLKAALPAFKDTKIVEQWAGFIDVTPDAVPAISPVSEQPGLYVATGFSGHGFGIGPGAGKLAAELIQGKPTSVDPRPFALGRFHER